MSAENQLSVSTSHSAEWNYMIDHLAGIIQPLGAQAYVEAIMLQIPQRDSMTKAHIHLANKSR